jgi:RNA polymerase sigma factor (sigma-70 family)
MNPLISVLEKTKMPLQRQSEEEEISGEPIPEWTDQGLLETIRSGGPKAEKAFNVIYHKYFGRLRSSCLGKGKISEAAAETGANDALVRVWTVCAVKKRALTDRKGKPVQNLWAYLVTIAKREAVREAIFESGTTKDREDRKKKNEEKIKDLKGKIEDLEQEGTEEALQTANGFHKKRERLEKTIADRRSPLIFEDDEGEDVEKSTLEGSGARAPWQESDPPTPDEEAWANQYREILRDCIEALPAQMKTIFQWVYEAELGQREIAEKLGMSLGTANTRVKAMHQTLRKGLEKKGLSLNDFLE